MAKLLAALPRAIGWVGARAMVDAVHNDQAAAPARASSGFPVQLGLAAIVAVAVLVAIFMLIRNQHPFKLSLDKESGVTVEVTDGESVEDVLKKAIAEHSDSVDAVLAANGYYRLTSLDWVNKLREIQLGQDVSGGVRQLLYDLAGPFSADKAFDGADGRLLQALGQEKEKADLFTPDSDQMANRFLAAVVRDSLDLTGVFDVRFNADVRQRFGGDPDDKAIYACSEVLVGKEISLVFNNDGNSRIYSGIVRRKVCPQAPTLEQLLGQQREPLELSSGAFQALYGPVAEGATPPPRLDATFKVWPVHLTTSEPG